MYELLAETLTHVVSFVLFVWILKRYAWTPIIAVLERRRQVIDERIDQARAATERARTREQELSDKLAEIKADEERRLRDAVQDGRRLADQIEQEARQKASRILTNAHEQAEVEQERMSRELEQQVANLSLAAAEHLLADTMDQALHRKLVAKSLDHIEAKSPVGAPS